MTINIRDKKYELIERIMQINDPSALDHIEEELDKINEGSIPSIPDIKKALKPIRSNVSLEDIKTAQNYKPIKYNEFMELASKVGIEEPIDELLQMLTK